MLYFDTKVFFSASLVYVAMVTRLQLQISTLKDISEY